MAFKIHQLDEHSWCKRLTYAVRSFFGVKVVSSSSSGGQRFFLGETPRLVYKLDI